MLLQRGTKRILEDTQELRRRLTTLDDRRRFRLLRTSRQTGGKNTFRGQDRGITVRPLNLCVAMSYRVIVVIEQIIWGIK